jgi:transposase
MPPIPHLTAAEWHLIKPLLPPGKEMRSRVDDRRVVEALFYCQAARVSIDRAPHEFGVSARTLRTRSQRWKASGVWPRLLEAGEPAIVRMRRELVDPEDLLERCSRVFRMGLKVAGKSMEKSPRCK